MQRFKVAILAALGLLVLAGVITAVTPKRVFAALGYTPVLDISNPALSPYVSQKTIIMHEPLHQAEVFFAPVPAGKRLVIDCVTAHQTEGQGSTLTLFTRSPVLVSNAISLIEAPRSGIYTATESVKIFADPLTTPSALLDRYTAFGGDAICSVTISGHLVSLP